MTKNFFYKECICCSNQERQIISTVGRNFTKLTTVICLGCGLIHSHPIPSRKELDEFYKLDYRKKYKLAENKKDDALREFLGLNSKLTDKLRKLKKDKIIIIILLLLIIIIM